MEPYPFKLLPYQHQLYTWERSRDLVEFGLFMDMGTGKSKVLIDTAAWLYDQGKIKGVVVVAPKGVYRTWVADEIPKHVPDHIPYEICYWSSYITKEILVKRNKFMKQNDSLKFWVVNIEALRSTNAFTLTKEFLQGRPCLMAVDESTTIKHQKAKQTENVIALGRYAKYRRILSGAPVTRVPMDLYSQCWFLNKNLLGFRSEYAFRNRYAILQLMQLGNRSFYKVTGFQRLDELTNKLKTFSYHITKDECLDLPEKIYMYREVELTVEQDKFYKQMKNLALVQLENLSVITAQVVMTKIQKLHEIVCGFIRDPVTGVVTEIPCNRINAVLDIIEETESKIIIWSNNTYDIEKLEKVLKEKFGPESVGTYYGKTEVEERERVRTEFQNPNSPLRFFISNPATGKFGVTLTEAKLMIYYSNSYDLEFRIQSEDRAHRIGQVDNLTIIDLITKNTVDQHIIKLLRNKKQMSEIIMGDEIKQWLE